MTQPMAPVPPTIPAPAPAPVSPPTGAGGGFSPPAPAIAETAPRKGGLPVGVIASIQEVYAKEEQKQMALQGLDKSLSLKPGWGGQGT
jgi:hypothetical protein